MVVDFGRSIGFGLVAAVACGLAAAPAARGEDVAPVSFTRDIRPILARNCFTCHGPDEGTRQAGLRLDLREGALAELESGAVAVTPGAPETSELYARLRADEFLRMPPVDSGANLSDEEIELIERWIRQGATYERHWSFEPIARAPIPDVQRRDWAWNEIDRFILHRLEQEGIAPSPAADRVTLIRRLSLDLIGLPPTPVEVESFLDDQEPGAYERLVDRLLASPHFGERWGRHWLDLARYADSDGYLGDSLRPYAYRYRDWVIDAINRDMPLDQFATLQIAGDLLEDATLEEKIATGFHRNSMKNTEAGADRELDRVIRTVDRVSTVGAVWLGLTVGCAECHSHKFDPLSHEEFYQLYAFFNDLEDVDLPAPLPDELVEYEEALHHWRTETEQLAQQAQTLATASVSSEELHEVLESLAVPPDDRDESQQDRISLFMQRVNEKCQDVLRRYEKVAAAKPSRPETKVAVVTERDQHRPTHVHLRGDFRRLGEEVEPGTPAVLHPSRPRDGERLDRLDLANWLFDPENPLTPRRTANGIWMHLFGRGLVATVDNLGVSGEAPSHPELLDWLAARLVDDRLTRKQFIRLIVTSATYRQSSANRSDLVQRDPLNVLLARQSRLRLEAEVIRDAALSVSGLLDATIGGPSIRPPMDPHLTAVSRNRKWEVSEGAARYRRGMYVLFRRATPYPMLTLFDAPDSTVTCAQRERSNSPLQALTLLNNPVFFECATHFGARSALIDGERPEEWLAAAFRRCLAREPSRAELNRLVSLYQEQRRQLKELSPEEIRELCGDVPGPDPEEQAARVVVARILMNLDEFITRE